jgi:putative endonuclease
VARGTTRSRIARARPTTATPPPRTAGRTTGSREQLAERRARGQRAEDAVAELVAALGFEIIGRNVRVGALELDVVARKGALVAIVEVRTRGEGSFTVGLASVDAKKRASLLRAAERLWKRTLSKLAGVERVRIDVAAVTFDESGTHVEYVEAAVTA